MKKTIIIAIAVLWGFNLYSQTSVNTITIIGKTDTSYVFSITGKNLDEEYKKFVAFFGNPVSEKPGEVIWEMVKIPGIGEELQIKLLDGLMTIDGKDAKFRTFSKTINKNKSKNCQLKCLEENQFRQIYIEILDKENKNIINSIQLRDNAIKYIEQIIN